MYKMTWKATALTAALLMMPSTAVHAQRLGIVAGGTFSQLRGIGEVKAKNRNGTMFGLSLTLPAGSSVAIQPELLFVNKGSEFDISGGGTRNVKLDYLEIPLLLRFDKGAGSAIGPHFYVGPSVGYNLDCSVTLSGGGIPNTSSDCKNDNFFEPKSLDWGAIVGAGLDLSLGGIGVTGGARYGIGLANISKDNSSTLEQRVRNGTLTVYAGLLFGRR